MLVPNDSPSSCSSSLQFLFSEPNLEPNSWKSTKSIKYHPHISEKIIKKIPSKDHITNLLTKNVYKAN
jgi:hypothetical protein